MTEKSGFFEELKRRHVWRVAVAYAVAAWLVVQIATQVFPFFNIPDWFVRVLVILLAIGFPVAVAFAWIYEVAPEGGIRRTERADSPAARPDRVHRDIGRKLNAVIIAVLVLAVALMGWRLLALDRAPPGKIAAAPAAIAAQPASGTSAAVAQALAPASATVPVPAAGTPEKSVAVLPFANDSGDKDQQYFSDGLSQDLITALTQFAGLKVISRDSAFQFRGSRDSPAVIATKLGVAHLLEGSVQKQGGAVRISVTLVNAADGSVVWSQRYDKPYKDLFALQDAITQSVADALEAKLLTAPGAAVQSDRPPSGNLDAYTAYLRGINAAALGTEASRRAAVAAFEQAIRLDPNYAAAFAQLSQMWVALASQYVSGAEARATFARARAAADSALQLAPDSSLAHQSRAVLLRVGDMDWRGAEAEARRALQLAPNDANAQVSLGIISAALGQNQRAVDLVQRALRADPRHATWYMWLATYQAARGRLDDATRAAKTAIALQPGAGGYHWQLAVVETLRGDARAALAAAQEERAPTWRRVAVALATQIGPDRKAADAALRALIAESTVGGPYQIAQVYALRRDPGAMFEWLDRAWTARDPGVGYLLNDPIILRYRGDPRFAAFCRKVGLPTITDAVAMK